MASLQTNYFPYFPLPPPHHHPLFPPNLTPPKVPPLPPNPPNVAPSHYIPTPPKVLPPPSPPKLTPPYKPPTPPKVAPPRPNPPNVSPPHNIPAPPKVQPPSPNAPFSPKVPPPAPHNPITPPQPNPVPAPPHHPFYPPPHPSPIVTPPPPPAPAPGHHSTVILIVFVSLGGLFLLAFLSVALCYFIKKRKKKMVQKTEILSIDEHVKVQEAIVPGRHGEQNKILLIEDDIHIEEEIKKNEKTSGGISHSHLKSSPKISHAQASDGYSGSRASLPHS